MPFRLVSHTIQSARSLGDIGGLNDISEALVRQCAQEVVSINPGHICTLVCDKRCWDYCVVFDAATIRGNNYIDVRLRLCVRGRIGNLHGLAIPFHEPHKEGKVHNTVKKYLAAIFGEAWRSKLISAATDGARNMKENFSVAVTRFGRDANPGFFHIWCAPLQLDLNIQNLMTEILSNSSRSELVASISHLCRQYKLRVDIGTTNSTIAATFWLSLGTVAPWISGHCSEIVECGNGNNSFYLPSSKWSVLLAAVKLFIEPIGVCFKFLHDFDTVHPDQNKYLNRLVSHLKSAIRISYLLSSVEVLASAGGAVSHEAVGNRLLED